MEFFISSEIDGRFSQNVPDKFRRVRKNVGSILNKHFLDKDYGANIKSIGVIPILIRTDLKEFYKERKLYQKKQIPQTTDFILILRVSKKQMTTSQPIF
ncbi:hypothetical protein LEP1GSC029_3717 [Leptospira interrogans str. 2002000626]|uniref:Uncharacterized protein n=1 Tax=Leptospira interrogans str. 2002000626 TaxID=996803 RepID=A0A829D1D6_LEPIR|nr:hypothetical protein LEP1GSC029_3717 [Leptospira interrogans str. 2002000626]